MTYFERPVQLRNTLDSFAYHGYGSDVEVIVVDDGSLDYPASAVVTPRTYAIKVIYLDRKDKWYCNPCIPFNIGLKAAKGEIVIIQNAECFHYNPIVEHASLHASVDKYLTYACLSQVKTDYDKTLPLLSFKEIKDSVKFADAAAIGDGVLGWYNHSRFNPRALHFCAALHSSSLKKLNGFDERYALGSCFDDDEFLFRVRDSGLKVEIVDDFVVVHQWHYNRVSADPKSGERYIRNSLLFTMITTKKKPYWSFLVVYFWSVLWQRIRGQLRKNPSVYFIIKTIRQLKYRQEKQSGDRSE
jgi:hypothetical protein